jgi:GNAT superfamily N-acetyltransferase
MTNGVSLQRVTEQGSEAFQFVLDCASQYFAEDHMDWNQETSRACLAELTQRSDLGRVWIIHFGELHVGYAIVAFGFDHEVGGRLAVLTDLYIRSDVRSCGVGSAALLEIESFCKAEQCRAIELQTQGRNKAARRFYERMGYVPLERTPYLKELA